MAISTQESGSATTNFDVIGRFGETHRNASGQRLIHLLHGTSMYALNGRHPCLQPAWTRCRMSRSEQSILDYVLVGTDCFSRAPPVQVLQADVSDHYLVHFVYEPQGTLHCSCTLAYASQVPTVRNCRTCMLEKHTVAHLHHNYLFSAKMQQLSYCRGL